jgi:hypothetical protein
MQLRMHVNAGNKKKIIHVRVNLPSLVIVQVNSVTNAN